MATFVEHQPCKRCGSRDNLGVYSDGSKYCFGCGYSYTPKNVKRSLNELRGTQKAIKESDGTLPYDCTTELPEEPLKWLKGYGLTNKEIEDYGYLWSDSRSLLVFPIVHNGIVVAWQGRSFELLRKKYHNNISSRSSSSYICFGNKDSLVVIVEDVISAIKVARVNATIPLFGSHISLDLAKKISSSFDKMIVWLDPDKKKDMLKFKNSYGMLFKEGIECIFSDKDPKYYSTIEIRKYLNIGIDNDS